MNGNHLIIGGLFAALLFWVVPGYFVQGKSLFLPFGLAVAFGFSTGILAKKAYNSLLADGAIDPPLMTVLTQLIVLSMQFMIAFALSPILNQF